MEQNEEPVVVETVEEPIPIGLPKLMEHLNRQQMAQFMIETLRKDHEPKAA